MASLVLFIMIWRDLHAGKEGRPFFLSIGVFLTAYLGLGISLWPWLVPFAFTFRQAAAAPPSQSLLLIGTVILLPVVLTYTGYSYYIFRGKASMKPATESQRQWVWFLVLIFTLLATPIAGADKDESNASTEEWREWVGKKVDVDYRACEPAGCVLVRGAPLKEVTDEAIVVVVNGSPFFIPVYMIQSVCLSK